MATWNAFYVRTEKDISAAIREKFPNAQIEAAPQFVGVHMPDDAFEAPERTLTELSARLNTNVIWLGFQSTVDAFQFHHWRSGVRLRSLVFGCFQEERTWERVEGQPEPWERAVFFSQEELDRVLEYTHDEKERQEKKRIWREGEILPGRTEPEVDSRECAHKIATHFGFPHYGL